ncbi:MAG: 2-aminoethylphosphonate--pyruvate transaminase [Rhodospirillales bacterium]
MSSSHSSKAATATGDSWLFTPGPLTTSASVKAAAGHDLGSRDGRFLEVNDRLMQRLLAIAGAAQTHVCVPLQGSGTFAVEAMLTSLLPGNGKLLILKNGAYGARMERICKTAGLSFVTLAWPETEAVVPETVAEALAQDPAISHVALVWCETTTGLLNPLEAVAHVVAKAGRRLLIDAMSAFGALPIDAKALPFEALAASSNKCLQGLPGLGFCLVEQRALEDSEGNAVSLSLDLHDQWQGLVKTGQWRFTPPVQIILALDRALEELWQEGGVPARHRRYRDNCRRLTEGLGALGFRPLLPPEQQAPIIVTLLPPRDGDFDFKRLYDGLAARGFLIYPGKLTEQESFRIGCIGDLAAAQVDALLRALSETLAETAAS